MYKMSTKNESENCSDTQCTEEQEEELPKGCASLLTMYQYLDLKHKWLLFFGTIC